MVEERSDIREERHQQARRIGMNNVRRADIIVSRAKRFGENSAVHDRRRDGMVLSL